MKFSTGGNAAFADESANKQRIDGRDDYIMTVIAQRLPSTVRFRDRRYSPDERRKSILYVRFCVYMFL